MHTYYFDGLLQKEIALDESESRHATKVMRAKMGETVRLINGIGYEGTGEIVNISSKHCTVKVLSTSKEERNTPLLTVAIAPTKSNDRIEWFLEKATEIGVDEIIPLLCNNGERTKINLDRWERVVLSAVKQSKRLWKPVIHQPVKISEMLDQQFDGDRLLAYCEELPEVHISDFANSKNDKMVLIGPEGDFTVEEVNQAKANGCVTIQLGKNRLRTETAGVVACTLLKI